MTKCIATKDIYHKGKLIKQGTVVISDSPHKYLEPYVRNEETEPKEPIALRLKTPEGAKYNAEGAVVSPKDKVVAKAAAKSAENKKPEEGKKTKANAVANSEEEDDNEQSGQDVI